MNPDMVWFTSDHHLGHQNIIRLGKGRPFPSIEVHDEELIGRWNEVVKPNHIVFHLGDIVVRSDRPIEEYVKRLNGRIHLILGNHDSQARANPGLFKSVHEGILRLRLFRQQIVLCHYPLRSWEGSHRGWWHLHGHSHCYGQPWAGSVDVGVDGYDFRPVSWHTIEMMLGGWKGVTHHPVEESDNESMHTV